MNFKTTKKIVPKFLSSSVDGILLLHCVLIFMFPYAVQFPIHLSENILLRIFRPEFLEIDSYPILFFKCQWNSAFSDLLLCNTVSPLIHWLLKFHQPSPGLIPLKASRLQEVLLCLWSFYGLILNENSLQKVCFFLLFVRTV